MHLKYIQATLPYLAAAGHSLYTISSYIYVQQMLELQEKHASVHAAFMHGWIPRREEEQSILGGSVNSPDNIADTHEENGNQWSEQNKEASEARQLKDDDDMRSLIKYIQYRNPFAQDESLQSIAIEVTAIKCHPDNAKKLG
ncbi:hypothetical protein CAPTEDRAFT_211471 [Capitella teleta]|uniref:Uncharacterized protein n=1 Tax=Capitella teleta TaxID=283909 RepID=R7UDM9_CAPTE|nr:hypothetical protein CAPTEDRAFT_211471 [Capitella teleta]|eukprot:ELU01367.1 hypothetical protein CAPTEDRAFT_211471 [Capitella teleta]